MSEIENTQTSLEEKKNKLRMEVGGSRTPVANRFQPSWYIYIKRGEEVLQFFSLLD